MTKWNFTECLYVNEWLECWMMVSLDICSFMCSLAHCLFLGNIYWVSVLDPFLPVCSPGTWVSSLTVPRSLMSQGFPSSLFLCLGHTSSFGPISCWDLSSNSPFSELCLLIAPIPTPSQIKAEPTALRTQSSWIILVDQYLPIDPSKL